MIKVAFALVAALCVVQYIDDNDPYLSSENMIMNTKILGELTEETATIEHYVPLGLGGLDNRNNMVLACDPCNSERGCSMKELKGV